MKSRTVVLVTGSRDWTDRDIIFGQLDRLDTQLVVHGDARGADSIAAEWAHAHGCPQVPMPAQWNELGMTAGTVRNGHMLDVLKALRACGWTVIILAFPLPSSKGTWSMVGMAKKAGFVVTIVQAGEA